MDDEQLRIREPDAHEYWLLRGCQRVSGGKFGGQWRCVRGNRAYRFEFGD